VDAFHPRSWPKNCLAQNMAILACQSRFPRVALAVISLSIAAHACASGQGQPGFVSQVDVDAAASPDVGPSLFAEAAAQSDTGSLIAPNTTRDDFANPVLDVGVPSNAQQLFGAADRSGLGPCLFEPEVGSLFPNNWLPLRFRFTTNNQENLYQITLVVPNEVHPLIIYTAASGYVLSNGTWGVITAASAGAPIHLTVRSAVVANGQLAGGPWKGTDGDVEIAPVAATGSIVYWTTSSGTVLKGFHVGDATVQTIVTPTQSTAGSQCVGCHSSTPDGLSAAFVTTQSPNNGRDTATVDLRSVDGQATRPAFLGTGAAALLARPDQEAPAFSRAHWSSGDRVQLSMLALNGRTEIVWTDLEAASQAQGTGWGVLPRNGDGNMAASASFSHDGRTVVYTSAISVDSGNNTDDGLIFRVAYGNRMGGSATGIAGASDPAYEQYYPVFSADDQFVAFNRIAAGTPPTLAGYNKNYSNNQAEVFVVPARGGQPVRLLANVPPACTGLGSPGITNSWPKWSPEVNSVKGTSYYFLVFSSMRDPMAPTAPQLYVAPITVDPSGTLTSYSALYFRNQPETEHNHTPAWDVFQLPSTAK
jgi:mono/diheme cytochrome c family protein